jgi:NADPH-ferrihemoprotein reductase
MIGPGTELASFRAFLQERFCFHKQYPDKASKMGANMFHYGCRHQKQDFLYENELKLYTEIGLLTKLYCAFSRNQLEKLHVAHLMKQNSQEIWNIIDKNISFALTCY